MKRFFSAICTLGMLATALPVTFAASTQLVSQVSVTNLASNGAPSAILPNNPFYGLKVMFERLSGGSTLQAALVRLGDKAAEVLTSERVAPENDDLFLKSLRQYEAAALSVFTKIRKINVSETGEAGTEKRELFLQTIDQRLITNLIFTSDLLTESKTTPARDLIIGISRYMQDALLYSLTNFESPQSFRSRLVTMANGKADVFYPLRLGEAIRTLLIRGEQTRSLGDSGVAQLRLAMHDFITMVAGAIEADMTIGNAKTIAGLPNVAGNKLLRLISIAALSEQVSSPDARSALSLMKANGVEVIAQSEVLGPEDVQEYLDYVENEVSELLSARENITPAPFTSVNQLIARGQFNGEQARVLFSEGNYAGAYLQAALSDAATGFAFIELPDAKEVYEAEMSVLRASYDELVSRAKAFAISSPDNEFRGTIDRLLADAAIRIAETSTRIIQHKEWSAIPVGIQNIKLRLATIDALAAE